jgi:hypothetical protein
VCSQAAAMASNGVLVHAAESICASNRSYNVPVTLSAKTHPALLPMESIQPYCNNVGNCLQPDQNQTYCCPIYMSNSPNRHMLRGHS